MIKSVWPIQNYKNVHVAVIIAQSWQLCKIDTAQCNPTVGAPDPHLSLWWRQDDSVLLYNNTSPIDTRDPYEILRDLFKGVVMANDKELAKALDIQNLARQ